MASHRSTVRALGPCGVIESGRITWRRQPRCLQLRMAAATLEMLDALNAHADAGSLPGRALAVPSSAPSDRGGPGH